MTISEDRAKPNPAADASAWSATMLHIGQQSQDLLNDFLARMGEKNMVMATPAWLDPANLREAFTELQNRILNSPERLAEAQIGFWQDYIKLCRNSLAQISGEQASPVIKPAPNDKRFQDAAWREVWLFDFIKQSYLISARWAQNFVHKVDDINPKLLRKLDFYTRQMVDAIAPSNFWLTNPEVLRKTIETGGENLVKGLEHLLADIERGRGQLSISMSDNSAFQFGKNIATTKGKVVFQNDLIQLIQYEPTTAQVHKTPLLIVPPWINKYYILDLREKNSYIRYLVDQGHTVFCVSWVNPDESYATTNFDDYMESGMLAAMRAVAAATSENKINIVGYCIGGTLLASTLAYLTKLGDKRPTDVPEVSSATYLVTLVDFAEPGDLGVFIDEEQIGALEQRMEKQGYLDAYTMATSFNLLRANDLIWSFVINNYLLGREPFPFDLLTWNSDSTNLPAAMQSYYLRNMYLHNKLIEPDALSMKGVPIDLRQITTPSFLLSTRDDHIAPWRSTYAATQLYNGPMTFVLSGSGHIAGVVNPPAANKYSYWTNPKTPAHPDDWLKDAAPHQGSWWPEWLRWLAPFSGPQVQARQPQNAIEDAPGSYVVAKSL